MQVLRVEVDACFTAEHADAVVSRVLLFLKTHAALAHANLRVLRVEAGYADVWYLIRMRMRMRMRMLPPCRGWVLS